MLVLPLRIPLGLLLALLLVVPLLVVPLLLMPLLPVLPLLSPLMWLSVAPPASSAAPAW